MKKPHTRTAAAFLLLVSALLSAACGAREEAPAATATNSANATTATTATAAATTTSSPASDTFIVNVTLSSAAAAKLASLKETIVVDASYYGEPAGGPPPDAEGGHAVELGKQSVELLQAGRAVFSVANADPVRLQTVENRDVRVLINVFSGRRNAEDNLLDCGIFEDSTRVAVREPIRINCTLIGE